MRALLPFVALVALAGCGGDDEKTTKSSSKADYIAKADAVCKKTNGKIQALNARAAKELAGADASVKPEDALARLAPVLEEGLEIQRTSAAELKAIEAPDELSERVEKLTAAYDGQIALVEKVGKAAKDRDVEAFQKLIAEQTQRRAQTREQALAIGFKECGRAS